MKIAIDCRSLLWKHSGIARYLDNILSEIIKKDTKNEYYLLSPSSLTQKYTAKNIHYVTFDTNDLLYKYLHTPIFLQREKIHLYWSPTHELPFVKIKSCRYICTIHDIAFEHDISSSGWKVKLFYFLGIYARSARIADAILTDSEYSKKDIQKKYGVSEKKIFVTHIGIDKNFHPIPHHTAQVYVKKKFGIQNKYIFYVNTGRPKNLLIAMQELLKTKYKDLQLVCLGNSLSQEENIEYVAQKLGISQQVLKLNGFISDTDLNNVYSGAELFVCPSYFEGFGLTPLEALRCGTPVLVSNTSALPEIFKDATLYCDPYDTEDIAKAMQRLLSDKSLQQRLLKNSNKLMSIYDWNKIGDKIITIFTR